MIPHKKRTHKAPTGILYIRGLPIEVHSRFKAMCAKRGISMQKMITRLIKKALEQEKTHGRLP